MALEPVMAVLADIFQVPMVQGYLRIRYGLLGERLPVVHDVSRPVMAFLAQAAVCQDPVLYVCVPALQPSL
jgi:hypothetical protein